MIAATRLTGYPNYYRLAMILHPTASNPAPITVQCMADVPASDITAVIDEADNCTANPVVAFVSETCYGNTCPEIITRTYSVTDDCGNQITRYSAITVNDDIDPMASNPAPDHRSVYGGCTGYRYFCSHRCSRQLYS